MTRPRQTPFTTRGSDFVHPDSLPEHLELVAPVVAVTGWLL